MLCVCIIRSRSAKSPAHAIAADFTAAGKKLKALVEERRYAAQERSEKAARDHRLEEMFERCKDLYDAGVKHVESTESSFYAHGQYNMCTIFPKFLAEAEELIKVLTRHDILTHTQHTYTHKWR